MIVMITMILEHTKIRNIFRCMMGIFKKFILNKIHVESINEFYRLIYRFMELISVMNLNKQQLRGLVGV